MKESVPPLRVTVVDDHFHAFLQGNGGVVHSVFSHAMNIRGDSGLHSIVCGYGAAPYSATIDVMDMPFSGVAVGDAVSVDPRGLVAVGDGITLDCSCARLFRSAFKRPGGCPCPAAGLAAFSAYCIAEPFAGGTVEFFRRDFFAATDDPVDMVDAALTARLIAFVTAIRERGCFEKELWRIIGAGPGLTPSGDDFVCGFLCALHNAADPVADDLFARMTRILSSRVPPTTDVSAQMLAAYVNGESAEVFRDLLEAFCGCRDMKAVMPKVRRVGHSSGMDFAVGMAAAFKTLLR